MKPDTSETPAHLHSIVDAGWSRFQQAAADALTRLEAVIAGMDGFEREFALVWAASDFVMESCIREPQLLIELLVSGDLTSAYAEQTYAERLQSALHELDEEADLHAALRQFRRREMVRIVWRDFSRRADLFETVRDMSGLADACIACAEAWLFEKLSPRWGIPKSADGTPQHMVILGLGKLGAGELNVSSDVDLMFFFPEDGNTEGGTRETSHQQFFMRLGQKLIAALNQQDANGFVFRVDMRLRPYGQSGALVMNFESAESYYQEQGREWERYAMIKARPVGGDLKAGRRFIQGLQPFMYRRYLDFSAFASLRDMKALINQEVRRKGMQQDVKLGRGGIREVEFIVQAFQLIRGGRDARLRDPRLWEVLELLGSAGHLPGNVVEELQAAYVFLRNTEHAIQGYRDQQTQSLPGTEPERLRIAMVMGFNHLDEFMAALKQHRDRVNVHFESIIDIHEQNESPEQPRVGQDWVSLWGGELSGPEAVRLLTEAGYATPDAALQLIVDLRDDERVARMQQLGRERLELFMPMLLQALTESDGDLDPQLALERILPLVRGVLRRSAYLLLLHENPGALRQLVRLCGASPWIAAELVDSPSLLEELINAKTLYAPPGKLELQDALAQQLLRIPEHDVEQQMECLRYFKDAHVLRVAASEVCETLPLMKVSDYLTWIAEVILGAVLNLAWQYMTLKHGRPGMRDGVEPAFVILAYGKLGGIELGYHSDLDLVFIHDAEPGLASKGDAEGRRSIENSIYFTRLAQRLIHLLNTRTGSGILYEVDVRLRPSGASGLLVTRLDAFEAYQLENAWTWEHQALVRARVVAGDPILAGQMLALRAKVLSQSRELPVLRQVVREMREKMRTTLGTSESSMNAEQVFDLKQDQGAIVDIEFMVQYAVLAWSGQWSDLLTYTDNIRILEALAELGLLEQAEADMLTEAYQAYRSAAHRQALQNAPASVAVEGFEAYREGVARIWHRLIEAPQAEEA